MPCHGLLTDCLISRSHRLVESRHNNRIDSNLFQHSPDSQPYFSFGSYLEGIYQTRFDPQRLQVTGQPALVAHNASYVAMEASYQFQWTVNGKQWCVIS